MLFAILTIQVFKLVVSTFILCSHHHHPSAQFFSFYTLKLLLTTTPHFLLCPVLENAVLLSVSVNLTPLGTLTKWNHAVFILLWLA